MVNNQHEEYGKEGFIGFDRKKSDVTHFQDLDKYGILDLIETKIKVYWNNKQHRKKKVTKKYFLFKDKKLIPYKP